MALLEWLVLIAAAILLPPILQAMFVRRRVPESQRGSPPVRAGMHRIAGDREAKHGPARDPYGAASSRSAVPPEHFGDEPLHQEGAAA